MRPSPSEDRRYNDPNESDRGILLANQIHELCQQHNLLISENYNPKNLRPAAYTLSVGDRYIDSDGIERRLTGSEESILFKKNSIIFVSTKETLNLPYYIVARFNLRVEWVYDGILLGTGPQVDPGFCGYLSCPLYNLTNSDILIKQGDLFATIDFEKTTSLLEKMSGEERKTFIEAAQNKKLVTTASNETYSFYRGTFLPALGWRKTHKIISSLTEMEEEVGTWRKLGIASAIAFLGLTLSLLAFGSNLYRQNSELTRQLTDGKNELQQAAQKISKLEDDVNRLSRAIEQTAPVVDAGKSGERKRSAR
jgi:deoxycytidine triphosphate deaminase/cell division protein FtsB